MYYMPFHNFLLNILFYLFLYINSQFNYAIFKKQIFVNYLEFKFSPMSTPSY